VTDQVKTTEVPLMTGLNPVKFAAETGGCVGGEVGRLVGEGEGEGGEVVGGVGVLAINDLLPPGITPRLVL
jgi:hypothetical protein